MSTFILVVEASVNAAGGSAPTLDILVNGSPVASSTAITAVTGVGSDILQFTLEYTGNYPTSLSFRFNGGSGDPGDVISLDAVRINGQTVSAGSLTGILIAQGASQSVTSTASLDHLFGRVEPTAGDLGTPTITGTGASETLSGTSGDDVIDASSGGNDIIYSRDGNDAIIGGTGDDLLYGQNGNDIILGGAGADKIWGDSGGDTGDDLLFGQAGDDLLNGGAGSDVLNGGADNDTLIAGAGDDVLYGEAGDDRLIGQSGANVMYGDAGNDTLLGGINNDLMYGGTDNDTIHGGNGDDEIYGEAGIDFISGGNGNDTIDGGGGNDTILGLAGNDILTGGAGTDSLDGGLGMDTVDYTNAAAAVTASLFAGTASNDGDGGSDTLTAIENLTGSAFDDTLTGDNNANVIDGGTGNDILAGRGGADTLTGGTGTDTVTYANALAGVTASLATGTASNDGDGSSDTLNTIENLTGSAFDDTLTGDANANTLTGNGGDDTISGGGGIDTIDGNSGDDTLNGDAGNDIIQGGIGNDTIDGGADNDTIYALDNGISAADSDDGNTNVLNGGAGSDILYGSTGLDILNGDAGNDTLYSGAGVSIVSLLDNGFDADSEDFTYSDGGFGGTDPAGDIDVFGSYITTDGGTANGALEVYADQTKNNSAFSNASGSWDTSITTDNFLTNVQITFSYRHLHDANNDAGEDSQVYFEFDGTILDASGGNSFLSEALGSAGATDTGWITVTIDLPDLAAGGVYDLSIGILHLGSNRTDEDASVRIDDVAISGNTGIYNGLNGGAGQDALYGNNGGTDQFVFESGDENTNDQIHNFSLADQDAFNLMSVLNGVYESATDDITQFVQITTVGANSVIYVDLTGTGTFGANILATVIGVTGLEDEAALEAAGTLITPIVTLDIIGTPLPDTLNGTAVGEAIGGLASNDLIYGAGGNDALYGFEGSDTAYYASASGAVTASLATGTASNDGDGGSDTFNSIENLTGSAFGDNLTGDAFANILSGLAGNDTLNGGDGNDTLIGGAGTDTITGGLGSDTADYTNATAAITANLQTGSASNDGDGASDTLAGIENLTGSAYNDSLTGDANANVLSGLAGNDTLTGRGGNDTLNGGADTDTIDYSTAAGGVTVNLNAGAASDDGDGGADTLISIENVTGSASDDTLIGGAGNNTLLGGNGNDSLSGRGGNDTLNGGAGTDTANYISATASVTASLATNTASNDGDGGTDTFIAIENLNGSNFSDILTGDGSANVLTGNIGSDTLNGGAGNDTLYALGDGAIVATTFVNQNFSGGLGTFTFAGSGLYFTNDLSLNDNDGNNSAHINLGRNGGSPHTSYTNISGTYSTTITFTEDTSNVELSLFYNIISTALDIGETPVMNILWNGVNIFTDNVTPNGGTVDSGWLSTGAISIGDVLAGSYTLQLQGLLGTSSRDEDADFYFDQVLVTGDVGSAAGDAGYTNTLNGGDGQDSLYGADGDDIFVFDDGFGNDDDQIFSFTSGAGNDALDISDILVNAGYDPLTDLITDFVEITDNGADSFLRIDTTGTATFGGTPLATIIGVTGLTDEAALETAGTLITA